MCFSMTTLVLLYSYPESNMAASLIHFSADTLQASFSARGGYNIGHVGKKMQGWESIGAFSCLPCIVL